MELTILLRDNQIKLYFYHNRKEKMSTQRRCEIIKATDDRWYLILGNFEHAYNIDDCMVKSFRTEDDAWAEVNKYSNPGGGYVDRSGTIKPENIDK